MKGQTIIEIQRRRASIAQTLLACLSILIGLVTAVGTVIIYFTR